MSARRGVVLALALVAALAVSLFLAAPAFSYLPEFTGLPSVTGTPQPDRWDFSSAGFPVQWNLNPTIAGSHVQGTVTVNQVMTSSFATWAAAPNATISVTQGVNSLVGSESLSPSNINLICFICSDVTFSDAQTLAITITTTATAKGQTNGHGGSANFVGQIIKSDILFNPGSNFTTDGTCVGVPAGCQNLQVVATHEIGHFLGLDHSAVVRAVMFPSASTLTTLSYDDVAGLSTLYPKTFPDLATGSITGVITFSSGHNVFGAHVYAESTSSTNLFSSSFNIRKSPVGALTAVDGSYTINGLPPDSYTVTAEPLDGPVTNSDVSGYPAAFGQPDVQVNFTTRWH